VFMLPAKAQKSLFTRYGKGEKRGKGERGGGSGNEEKGKEGNGKTRFIGKIGRREEGGCKGLIHRVRKKGQSSVFIIIKGFPV